MNGASSPTRTAQAAPPSRATAMRTAAAGFLARLDATQRRRAVRPFEDAGRTRWSGFPGDRAGVPWGVLDAGQVKALRALLQTGLGTRGLTVLRGIRRLEGELRRREAARVRRDRGWRDPGLYHLAVFGTPHPTTPWAWRLEGHHLSWSFTVTGERVACTPRFQGTNPAALRLADGTTLRVLGAEEDAARHLLASLDTDRRTRAVVSPRAHQPSPSGNPDLRRAARFGITLGELSPPQRARLWALFEAWTSHLHPDLAAAALARAKANHPERITFAWAGSTRPGAPCFYRLHGDTVHLEYGRTANHVHSIWRDPRGDFARAPADAAAR